jgi:hypothetical protein
MDGTYSSSFGRHCGRRRTVASSPASVAGAGRSLMDVAGRVDKFRKKYAAAATR